MLQLTLIAPTSSYLQLTINTHVRDIRCCLCRLKWVMVTTNVMLISSQWQWVSKHQSCKRDSAGWKSWCCS